MWHRRAAYPSILAALTRKASIIAASSVPGSVRRCDVRTEKFGQEAALIRRAHKTIEVTPEDFPEESLVHQVLLARRPGGGPVLSPKPVVLVTVSALLRLLTTNYRNT